jgi:hypothetical protein
MKMYIFPTWKLKIRMIALAAISTLSGLHNVFAPVIFVCEEIAGPGSNSVFCFISC